MGGLKTIAGAFLGALCLNGCATDGNSDYTRVLTEVLGAQAGALTEGEIAAGLKEALVVGSGTVVTQISALDGYLGDDAIKIPLPDNLSQIQSNLGKIGLAGPLNDLEVRLNRAAEAAAPTAKKLVVDAVSSMTIDDALGILNGGDNAATNFLKEKTSAQLHAAFRPYMDQALDDSGAVNVLETSARKYLPNQMVSDARDDLASHAVDGALDGMFYYLAKEEEAIRKDPVKRTTDLLKKVFGA